MTQLSLDHDGQNVQGPRGRHCYGDDECVFEAKGVMARRIDEIDLSRSLNHEESERRISVAQRRLVQRLGGLSRPRERPVPERARHLTAHRTHDEGLARERQRR